MADLGGKQLWLDEIIQALHSAPGLSLSQVLRGVTQDRGAAPLDYVIQHYVSMLLGQSEFALRLHAAVFGIATVAALYFLVRKLADARTALICAGLYAIYPLHQRYSQEGRPYALFVFLTLCSFLTFCRVLQKRSAGNWILYSCANALLLYSQYFGAFVLFSQVVFSLAMMGAPAFKQVKPIGSENSGFSPVFFSSAREIDLKFVLVQACTMALLFLLLLPWLIFGVATIIGYKPQPVHFGFKLFLSFIQGLGDGSHPLAWILIILAALGLRKLTQEKRYQLLSLLLCWCVLPVPLIFLLLWIKDYFFAVRHFLFITPALFVMVTLGIEHLADALALASAGRRKISKQQTTAVAIALVAAVSLLVIGLHIPDTREDLRGAGEFLKANVGTDDIVVAPEIDVVLSFYFPQILAHSRPVAVLNDAATIETVRRIFVVKTDYISAADEKAIDSALQEFPRARRVPLRDVEILQIPGI